MKIENIKTPEDILEFMNENIEYGWIDINGNKHIREMKNFRRLYKVSSINETLSSKLGTCIEQVYLMHNLLDKINVPSKMFVQEYMREKILTILMKKNTCTAFFYTI